MTLQVALAHVKRHVCFFESHFSCLRRRWILNDLLGGKAGISRRTVLLFVFLDIAYDTPIIVLDLELLWLESLFAHDN